MFKHLLAPISVAFILTGCMSVPTIDSADFKQEIRIDAPSEYENANLVPINVYPMHNPLQQGQLLEIYSDDKLIVSFEPKGEMRPHKISLQARHNGSSITALIKTRGVITSKQSKQTTRNPNGFTDIVIPKKSNGFPSVKVQKGQACTYKLIYLSNMAEQGGMSSLTASNDEGSLVIKTTKYMAGYTSFNGKFTTGIYLNGICGKVNGGYRDPLIIHNIEAN